MAIDEPAPVTLYVADCGLIMPRGTAARIVRFRPPPGQNVKTGDVFLSETGAARVMMLRPHALRLLAQNGLGPDYTMINDSRRGYQLPNLETWLRNVKSQLTTEDMLPFNVGTALSARLT
jgi:hypothetical protein